MAENTLKKAVDDWEKEADRLIEETKKLAQQPLRSSINSLKRFRMRARSWWNPSGEVRTRNKRDRFSLIGDCDS